MIMENLENKIVNVIVRRHLTFEKICQRKKYLYGVHNFDFRFTGENCGEYGYELNLSQTHISLLFDLGMCYYQEGHTKISPLQFYQVNDIFKTSISDWAQWHENCKIEAIETTLKIVNQH